MGRPKGTKNKVEETAIEKPIEVAVDSTSTLSSGTTKSQPETSTLTEPATVSIEKTRATFTYPVPETKEDLLSLHKCLKDTGVNSIGDLEVRASRL